MLVYVFGGYPYQYTHGMYVSSAQECGTSLFCGLIFSDKYLPIKLNGTKPENEIIHGK
jgi:hypothetical protein